MFDVTEAYKTQVRKPVKVRTLHGKLANIAFTPRDVVMDSFSISNQCSDSGRFTIGETFSAELNITFTEAFISEHWSQTDINYWKRKVIEISIDLEVPQESGEVPCSVFRVSDIQKDNGGYHIVGYDLMGRFERKLRNLPKTGKPYDYLVFACNNSNMVLGMTSNEVKALPNGNDVLEPWENHEMKTYRDLIAAVSEYCGSFATIDRAGNLVLRSYNAGLNQAVWEYTDDDIKDDISISKVDRRYTVVIGESKTLEETISSITSYDDEEVVDIGANPFMQRYDRSTFSSKLENISHGLPQDWHTPCSLTSSQDYFLDLGDKIELPNGDYAYVMAYEFTMQGITITCYGEDTEASTTSSGGSDSSSAGSKVIFFYTESQAPFTITNGQRQIVNSIDILADQDSEANTWTEIKGTVTKDDSDVPVKVQVIYLYDDEAIDYSPEFTFNEDGKQTFSLNYFLESIDSSMGHSWDVVLKVTGGTFQIQEHEVHTLIWGQGLSKSARWDGKIKVTDEIRLAILKYCPNVLEDLAADLDVDLLDLPGVFVTDITDSNDYRANTFNIFADFVIITVGEPNPNNIFFTGEAYSGENVPLI